MEGKKLKDLVHDGSISVFSEYRGRRRKSSDFDEYKLDKELNTQSPCYAPHMPLEPLKKIPENPPVLQVDKKVEVKKPKAFKLDEYFKSQVIVNKVIFYKQRMAIY